MTDEGVIISEGFEEALREIESANTAKMYEGEDGEIAIKIKNL